MKLDFLPFACQDFLCVHAKRDFPDFTCTNFSSRACEKRISGFDMHKLFKPYMRKEDFWISHAQTFQAVHVKREFSDLTCTLAQSVPLRIYISQVIRCW